MSTAKGPICCQICACLIPTAEQIGGPVYLYCFDMDHWNVAGHDRAQIAAIVHQWVRQINQLREGAARLRAALDQAELTLEPARQTRMEAAKSCIETNGG